MKHDYESRITRLEVTNENINATLLRIEKKIEDLDTKINARIDKVESRIDNVDSRLWQIMILMGATVLGFVVTKLLGLF